MRIDALRIKSNRKVPQTNALSLGVLDMDASHYNVVCRHLLICFSVFKNVFAGGQQNLK